MHIYRQDSGLWLEAGKIRAQGYSGHGHGKDNPLAQHERDVGPIPAGAYLIDEPRDTLTHGPFVLPLLAYGATNTYGRSGFLVHGDSREHPGEASHGCIILPRDVREAIARSESKLLVVLPPMEAAC